MFPPCTRQLGVADPWGTLFLGSGNTVAHFLIVTLDAKTAARRSQAMLKRTVRRPRRAVHRSPHAASLLCWAFYLASPLTHPAVGRHAVDRPSSVDRRSPPSRSLSLCKSAATTAVMIGG